MILYSEYNEAMMRALFRRVTHTLSIYSVFKRLIRFNRISHLLCFNPILSFVVPTVFQSDCGQPEVSRPLSFGIGIGMGMAHILGMFWECFRNNLGICLDFFRNLSVIF